jgi:hypothetical protein
MHIHFNIYGHTHTHTHTHTHKHTHIFPRDKGSHSKKKSLPDTTSELAKKHTKTIRGQSKKCKAGRDYQRVSKIQKNAKETKVVARNDH